MIEEHIADGDYVVIQQQEQARDGQIVAVRDDDGEATLKRFYKEKNRVRLEPANKTHEADLSRPRRHPRRPRRRRPEVLIRTGQERRLLCTSANRDRPARAPPFVRVDLGSVALEQDRLMATDSTAPADFVRLFTDGACSGNPGPGGWAYILEHPASGRIRDASGAEPKTTNNRMELTGVSRGLPP